MKKYYEVWDVNSDSCFFEGFAEGRNDALRFAYKAYVEKYPEEEVDECTPITDMFRVSVVLK
jgi:hypothetical protein